MHNAIIAKADALFSGSVARVAMAAAKANAYMINFALLGQLFVISCLIRCA